MERRLSGWKLRAMAEERGLPVSHKQLEGYLESGLIPDSKDGGWPIETVDRLVQIRKLEDQARPLWRRAILLHARNYPIEPSVLRDAVLRTLPTIKAPKRKMQRVDALVRWEANRLEDPTYAGVKWSKHAMPADDFMEPANWRGILSRRDIDNKLFAEHFSAMCYFAFMLKRSPIVTPVEGDISSIHEEEVIILLMVRQLAHLAKRAEAS